LNKIPGTRTSRPRVGNERVQVVTLPKLDDARRAFESKINAHVEWPTFDDEDDGEHLI
jgi:hypothetical protein